MSEAARAAVIEAHCRELKLPSVRRLYPEFVRQATQDGFYEGRSFRKADVAAPFGCGAFPGPSRSARDVR